MKLPPLMRINDDDGIFMDVKFTFSGEHIGDGSITVCDEGGGSFIVIETNENGLRLDPKELFDIGMWSIDACRALDEFHNPSKRG